ncbi:MAG: SDR family NAD(P)-dependent oxidoreductase [Rhodospirillales bacterium]|nr:MAG: SDR family NAD(P)-dependent oxidoreductase [Rhodospirillales bacterium]
MPGSVDLSGKIALVTGASRGIGAAVARAYAGAGAHVVLLARSVGGLEEVDDDIRASGGKATLMPQDLLDMAALERLGPALLERFGGLDIFVGNAGMLGTLGPLADADPKEFQKVMDTNVTANFRLIRTLDPLLRASEAGRAIFVSSGAAHGMRAYWGAYGISKAALEMLAKTYAAETVKTKIRVNFVDPGAVRTAMRASAYPGEDPLSLPAPEEVTDVFLELAAPDCTRHGESASAY